MAKPKNTNQPENAQVKYADPRMSHSGTHTDFVKKESNIKFSEINSNPLTNDYIVVAEDQNGLYVTGKSYINSGILDPYRMYHRHEYIVNATNDTYTVKCVLDNKEVTF